MTALGSAQSLKANASVGWHRMGQALHRLPNGKELSAVISVRNAPESLQRPLVNEPTPEMWSSA